MYPLWKIYRCQKVVVICPDNFPCIEYLELYCKPVEGPPARKCQNMNEPVSVIQMTIFDVKYV